MIFSRLEYSSKLHFLPSKKLRKVFKLHELIKEPFYISSSKTEVTLQMFNCHIFEENTIFRLIAGPNGNSVIVVEFLNMLKMCFPYELVKNISTKYIDYQVRLPKLIQRIMKIININTYVIYFVNILIVDSLYSIKKLNNKN